MLALSALLLGAFVQGAASKCECVATPDTPSQEKVDGKPEIPADYGYGCKAHDVNVGTCVGKSDTEFGKPHDFCLHKWCIVSEDCHFKVRPVSYTKAEDDVFSFEACEEGFQGNSWVGYCKNCVAEGSAPAPTHLHKSFCQCGGEETCPCVKGSEKQTKSDSSPDYVEEAEAYGYGCMKHDLGKDQCKDADTSAGSSLDWCADEWCIVDPKMCGTKTRPTAYTANPEDFFSFETCDKSFKGNQWVGMCKCEKDEGSYCSCEDGGGMGGEVADAAHTISVGGVLALAAAMVQ
jgi:hypothetical protein